MALYRPGPIVSEIRGSIGGSTFSRNAAGQYIRQRSNPVNPNTDRQQAVRTLLGAVAQRWSSVLDAAQRTAWDTYAAAVVMTNGLGDPVYLSGFQHYVRSNTARVLGTALPVDDGPTVLTLPPADQTLDITANTVAQLNVTWTGTPFWAAQDDGVLLISQSKPVGLGRTFVGPPFRFTDSILGNSVAPITSPQTTTTAWPLIEGQRMIGRARIGLDDGRLSQFMQFNFVIEFP